MDVVIIDVMSGKRLKLHMETSATVKILRESIQRNFYDNESELAFRLIHAGHEMIDVTASLSDLMREDTKIIHLVCRKKISVPRKKRTREPTSEAPHGRSSYRRKKKKKKTRKSEGKVAKWTCRACTYVHDTPEESIFLCCKLCATPRPPAPTEESASQSFCSICGDGGHLLLCDACPRAFHGACLEIAEDAFPGDDEDMEWKCPRCDGKDHTGRTYAVVPWFEEEEDEERVVGGCPIGANASVSSATSSSLRNVK